MKAKDLIQYLNKLPEDSEVLIFYCQDGHPVVESLAKCISIGGGAPEVCLETDSFVNEMNRRFTKMQENQMLDQNKFKPLKLVK